MCRLPDSATGTGTASRRTAPCAVGRRRAFRLPVFLPVRAADKLATALPAAVGDMLTAVGVPWEAIEQELAQMSPVNLGRTRSRSLLGSLTEFTRLAWFDFKTRPDIPLDVIARELAEVPLILPLKGDPRQRGHAAVVRGEVNAVPGRSRASLRQSILRDRLGASRLPFGAARS